MLWMLGYEYHLEASQGIQEILTIFVTFVLSTSHKIHKKLAWKIFVAVLLTDSNLVLHVKFRPPFWIG